jgi:4-hydroxy-tetrahydrodipicolinate reductase
VQHYKKITSNIIAQSFENVEIVEKHHSGKQDAPSGTAIDLALSLPENLKSTGIEGDFYSKNNINDKFIMSLRDDKFMAEQEVLFSNEFEQLNSEHIVNDRRAYLFGVKLLLDNIDSFQGFVYGLETILNKNISI